MSLSLNHVSITIPSDVVTQLKQVFLPTDNERAKFAEAVDTKAIAQELIDTHGNAIVNSIIDQRSAALVQLLAEQIDTDEIRDSVVENLDYGSIADNLSTSDIASEFDVSDIAREVDTSDLADLVANKIGAQDVAECFTSREIADELYAANIAEEIDLEELAKHIHVDEEAIAKATVKWLTNNSDGMSHFLLAFCRAYIEATTNASNTVSFKS